MGSINRSHHHDTGGVVVFNGELILLFCEAVHSDIDDLGTATGKIFLTTHRIIFTADKMKSSDKLQSFSAPFYAMFDLKLEQPVFGANYIKGKVRAESVDGEPLAFKLKFNKGGAIEFGQTMAQAAKQAASAARDTNFQAPPAYTPTAAEAHYQTASNAYQPMYPVGFALPTQVFDQAPPAGFVYAMDAPPPYPGLTTVGSQYQTQYSGAANPYQQASGYGAPFQQGPYAPPVPGPYAGPYAPPVPGPYAGPMPPQYQVPPQSVPYQNNAYPPQAPNSGYSGASAPVFDVPPPYDSGYKKTQ